MKIFIIALLVINTLNAKLLDKVLAVVDGEIHTLSQVKRIKENIFARRQISPFIYKPGLKLTNKNVIQLLINRSLIRNKLSEMGYVINDDQVEQQIRQTERKLGLNRDALLQFLNGNNMTFDEYFELIRETIEFNIFQDRVIRPLISVTDQEIKNEYYKRNSKNKTLSFNYNLVDFVIAKKYIKKSQLKDLQRSLKNFQKSGNIPEKYSKIEANDLGVIKEDGLSNAIKKVVSKTEEGEFSKGTLLGGYYHFFFVKKKDLVESDDFLRDKNRIRGELFMKIAVNIQELWYEREANKHYIKYFL